MKIKWIKNITSLCKKVKVRHATCKVHKYCNYKTTNNKINDKILCIIQFMKSLNFSDKNVSVWLSLFQNHLF